MTDPAHNYLKDAAEALHRPLTDAEWRDSVEVWQRAKVYNDALADLIKAHAKTTGQSVAAIRTAIKARAESKVREVRKVMEKQLELFEVGDDE